jgi:thiamine-phosphate pyrophosphorylase
MIIFTTKEGSIHSITEQVTGAINGGCRWIEIDMPTSNEDEIVNAIESIRHLCEQNEAILTLRRDQDMAKRVNVGGVRIDDSSTFTSKIRVDLGGSAFIGVKINTLEEMKRLSSYDIDYLCVEYDAASEDCKRFIADAVTMKKQENIELPLVADGDIAEADITGLLQMGINGIFVSSAIANSENPEMATKHILQLINK